MGDGHILSSILGLDRDLLAIFPVKLQQIPIPSNRDAEKYQAKAKT